MDLDAIRYMTNTTDSIEAQACHMLADAVTALTARVATLEATTQRMVDAHNALARQWDATQALAAPEPATVTIDAATFGEAINALRDLWVDADADSEVEKRLQRAIDLLTGGQN